MLILVLSRLKRSFMGYCLFFGGGPHDAACGILVPQLGIEPVPPALGVQSLNHWTREGKSLCLLV